MAAAKPNAQIEKDLKAFTHDACPGMDINVQHSERWGRRCLTFRWAGFADLLAEERFRLLARLIPADYFKRHCRDSVWLELAPDESVDDYLAQPRSEDVQDRLVQIWKMLGDMNFFAALEDELVRIPSDQCSDDFAVSKRVLDAKHASAQSRRDALLAFMRQQAYNDWEVLRQVRPVADSSAGD